MEKEKTKYEMAAEMARAALDLSMRAGGRTVITTEDYNTAISVLLQEYFSTDKKTIQEEEDNELER